MRFFAGYVRGVLLFHAFVFSVIFVKVLRPCLVIVSRDVGVVFAGSDSFSWTLSVLLLSLAFW